MPLFSYIIQNKFKKVSKGTTQANSEQDLRKQFREQGYLVFSITKTNEDKISKKDANDFEGFKLAKIPIILILIAGSWFLIKQINKPSYESKTTENPPEVEIIPKETIVTEIPKIIPEKVISKPKQNIVAPKLKPKQKEGVITIAFKGSKKLKSENSKSKISSSLYEKMLGYYRENTGRTASKATHKKTIRMAQKLLRGRRTAEEIEELKAIINDCRNKIRKPSK